MLKYSTFITVQNYKKKVKGGNIIAKKYLIHKKKKDLSAKNSPRALIFCEFIVLLHEEINNNKVKQAKNGNIFKTART